MPHPETAPAEPDDLNRLFDEELAKLPEEMRRAVVLCELQGLTRAAAAKQLRVSEGTLSSRLGRARKKLAAALTARGFKLAVPAAVGVSSGLAATTVRAATDPTGVVPTGVSYLVQEALTAMTISKLKLGVVLAAVAVGCTWAALAADPKPVTPPAEKAEGRIVPPAKADPAKPDPKPDPKPVATAVATVNGRDVSREEFGEYLIRKHGAKEIELFVNQRIIQDAAAEKDIRLPADEVVTAFEADAKGIGVSRAEFVKSVLPKYGKTEDEWWTDVLTPRLLLAKLLDGEVTVTDEELKRAFETKFGEQRRVQFMSGGKKLADSQGTLGAIAPIGRYTTTDDAQALHDAIFKLKLNEISDPIDTKQGQFTVQLLEVIPPQKGKKFEDEKAALKVEVTRVKVQDAIPKLFEKLKKEAKPVFHIKPEPKRFLWPGPKM